MIDAHTHIGDFPLFNVQLNSKELISIMNRWNIEKALVSTTQNSLTLKAVKEHPQRLHGLAWINPHKEKEAEKLVDKALTKWNFKGLKMHPLIDAFLPDQKIVSPIMDRLCKYRAPVLFHCGHPPWSLPWHFENLADLFPEVPIILGHMGHGHIVYIEATIKIAEKHENIILETSAMPMYSKIKDAVDRIGKDRVIYGSDLPFGHPAFETKKVEISGLNKAQLEYVLEKNASRIFGL